MNQHDLGQTRTNAEVFWEKFNKTADSLPHVCDVPIHSLLTRHNKHDSGDKTTKQKKWCDDCCTSVYIQVDGEEIRCRDFLDGCSDYVPIQKCKKCGTVLELDAQGLDAYYFTCPTCDSKIIKKQMELFA